jgi:hypothetical protein
MTKKAEGDGKEWRERVVGGKKAKEKSRTHNAANYQAVAGSGSGSAESAWEA